MAGFVKERCCMRAALRTLVGEKAKSGFFFVMAVKHLSEPCKSCPMFFRESPRLRKFCDARCCPGEATDCMKSFLAACRELKDDIDTELLADLEQLVESANEGDSDDEDGTDCSTDGSVH